MLTKKVKKHGLLTLSFMGLFEEIKPQNQVMQHDFAYANWLY